MIRCLVVDDEAPARAKLRRLLDAADGFTVVADAADGDAAITAIQEHQPDVVFLDIQMPRRDGFAVVRAIGPAAMPTTVFVTAFDDQALRAFEVEALDYLLKPFAAQRFERLLTRLRERFEAGPEAHLVDRLSRWLEHHDPPPSADRPPAAEDQPLRRLLVERGTDRQVLLAVDRIDLVRADGNYVRLRGPDGEFRKRGTLTELESRLDSDTFLRINRSEIVRLAAIAEIQPWFRGDYRILLHDGSILSWSRRYRARAPAELRT